MKLFKLTRPVLTIVPALFLFAVLGVAWYGHAESGDQLEPHLGVVIEPNDRLGVAPIISETHLQVAANDADGEDAASESANKGPKTRRWLDNVTDIITQSIAPDAWDDVGGDGSITTLDAHNLLIVSQTEEVHGEIRKLLDALFRAVDAQIDKTSVSSVPIYESTFRDATSARERIHTELARQTTIDVADTTLSDFAEMLEQLHGINVEFDHSAIEEVGISTDEPITKSVRGIPLESALTLTLRDLGLVHVILDDVLLITTPEAMQAMVSTKVYDVSALVGE